MSDIIEMFDKLKSTIELKEYATTLFQGLKRSTELLQQKEDEIKHLKELLAKSIPLIGSDNHSTIKIIKTTEEIIIEAEIEKLREVSQQRPLNLNETKQLDIYIKNLRLLQNKGDIDSESSKNKDKYSDAKLLEYASDE